MDLGLAKINLSPDNCHQTSRSKRTPSISSEKEKLKEASSIKNSKIQQVTTSDKIPNSDEHNHSRMKDSDVQSQLDNKRLIFGDCDFTVDSAMMVEFTTTERLRSGNNILQNKGPDFCINI